MHLAMYTFLLFHRYHAHLGKKKVKKRVILFTLSIKMGSKAAGISLREAEGTEVAQRQQEKQRTSRFEHKLQHKRGLKGMF